MERQKSIAYMFVSAVLFSIGGVLIKITPWSAMAINSFANILAAAVLYAYFKHEGHVFKLDKPAFLGAIVSALTSLTYFYGIKLTTAANATVLQFAAPIFIIFISWAWLKEKPKKCDVVACLTVFIGITCFFLDGLSLGNNFGNFLALSSGFFYALVFMFKRLSGDAVSPIFFGKILSFLIGAPFIFMESDFSLGAVLPVVIQGIVQIGLAFIFFIKGLEHITPVFASLISTAEPLLTPVWVLIFYKEKMSLLSIFGAVIVIFSIAVYNIASENSKNKLRKA